jgi:hypothetical protein
MIVYTNNLILDLGLNIAFNTHTLKNDDLGRESARALTNWCSRSRVVAKGSPLIMKGAAADTSNYAQLGAFRDALRKFIPNALEDTITIYTDEMARAGADAPAYTAITLAHEGVHAAQGSVALESEVDAFNLTIKLFRELQAAPVMVDAKMYGINKPAQFHKWVMAESYFDANSMIDAVFQISPLYKEKASASWIRDNYKKWGGITERDADTVALYLQNLAKGGTTNSAFIMEILEVYLPVLTSQAERQKVIDAAGTSLRGAVHNMRNSQYYFPRLQTLQSNQSVTFRD